MNPPVARSGGDPRGTPTGVWAANEAAMLLAYGDGLVPDVAVV